MTELMHHIDLCSGIGGFSLGFQWAGLSKPVLFCDTDAWCRKVLAKHWPDVPIAEDVKELANDPDRLIPDCNILTAGYPCPPFSLASRKGKQTSDTSGLTSEQLYQQSIQTGWFLKMLEDTFRSALPQSSMTFQKKITQQSLYYYRLTVSAQYMREQEFISWPTPTTGAALCGGTGNFKKMQKLCGYARCSGAAHRQPAKDWWATEPAVGRVAHGVSRRVDRLKGLGNAIVPQIAQRIGETIKKAEGL